MGHVKAPKWPTPGDYESVRGRLQTVERYILGPDGRVEKKPIDVVMDTGRPAWDDPDLVFEDEEAAHEKALEHASALSVKFDALAQEHRDWLFEKRRPRLGDRVRDDQGDEGTLIAFTPAGEAVVYIDQGGLGRSYSKPFVHTYEADEVRSLVRVQKAEAAA